MSPDVVVIGAGLAGLTTARCLAQEGLTVQVHEASDGVGGRVRTDIVDGFRLDRGFQVMLTGYPTAAAILDLAALDLQAFSPGALLWDGRRMQRLADPFRSPLRHTLQAAISTIGTPLDKLRLARLRHRMTSTSGDALLSAGDESTYAWLRGQGFSDGLIDGFFRPFLAGVLLDPELATSARVSRVLLRAFFTGDAAVPAAGMQAIPEQLAQGLNVRFGSTVADLRELDAAAVVVATEAPAAARLLGTAAIDRGSKSAACLCYAVTEAPTDDPTLVLAPPGDGPLTHIAVPSLAAPTYAPPGRHLVVASMTGPATAGDPRDQDGPARTQMRRMFGGVVEGWELIGSYQIAHGQPAQPSLPPTDARVRPGVYLAGDHMAAASIEGAIRSGVEAAQLVSADLRTGAVAG